MLQYVKYGILYAHASRIILFQRQLIIVVDFIILIAD